LLQRTSTLLSIIIVLSNCYKISAIAQAADHGQIAYQEVVDQLLEPLCTTRYVSCISICLKAANNGSLSRDLLKTIRNFINRAVIPRGHQMRLAVIPEDEDQVTLTISLFVDGARADTNRHSAAGPGALSAAETMTSSAPRRRLCFESLPVSHRHINIVDAVVWDSREKQ
jgi:hypothetical protein